MNGGKWIWGKHTVMLWHQSFVFPHSHQTDSDTLHSVRWDFQSPDGNGNVLLSQPPLDLGLWWCRQMGITQTDSSIYENFFSRDSEYEIHFGPRPKQIIYNPSFRKRRERGAHILPSLNALNWRRLLDIVNINNNTRKKAVLIVY